MATIDGNLWEHNLALVRIVDVSDDYRLMQAPMPGICYPVIEEAWLPIHGLLRRLPDAPLVSGYRYDWHETGYQGEAWYVGVVAQDVS